MTISNGTLAESQTFDASLETPTDEPSSTHSAEEEANILAKTINFIRTNSSTPVPAIREFCYSSEECRRNTEFNKNLKPTAEHYAMTNAKENLTQKQPTTEEPLPPTPESLLNPQEGECSPAAVAVANASVQDKARSVSFDQNAVFFDLCKNGPVQE